jgi:hypothetical protein
MTRDEQVLQTTITIEIELTGNQVRALSRAADEHCLQPEASKLVREIEDIYDDHFHNDMIRPDWDDD